MAVKFPVILTDTQHTKLLRLARQLDTDPLRVIKMGLALLETVVIEQKQNRDVVAMTKDGVVVKRIDV